MVLAARLLQGHRIRIQIAGSNFPNLERNLNTGGNNFDESKPVIATNRIYHDSAHPSSVTLTLSPD
jgi:predicted acyl esterase